MCTSIAMTAERFYFGRNLDLEVDFGQRVVITPHNYPFSFRCGERMEHHFALIGMAAVAEGYPLYADAANECGLYMAGLNFPQSARYSTENAPDKSNISPFELIPWVLGQCTTLSDARDLLLRTHIVAIDFSQTLRLTPLHWHIADKSGLLVLEVTANGMQIYDDPVGVLTNEPPFPFQLANLCHYLNLTPSDPCGALTALGLPLFGRGLGSIGLPGDCSPTSRFVRAAYHLHNSVCEADEESAVTQFFHLLDSVAMVRGAVKVNGQNEITRYSCCISAERGIYYYSTYENRSITAIDLWEEDLEGRELIEYPLNTAQAIEWAQKH